jgi:hypothetical protein
VVSEEGRTEKEFPPPETTSPCGLSRAYNVLTGGTRLEDIERLRDEVA